MLPTTEYLDVIAQITDAAMMLFLLLIVGIIVLMTPLANLLNVFTMPIGYQIQSCPYCPAVGVKKRERSVCAFCHDRFRHYGVPVSLSRPMNDSFGLSIPFCSDECSDEWKDGGEVITPEIAWAARTYRITGGA